MAPKKTKAQPDPPSESFLPEIRNPFLGCPNLYSARAAALIASQPRLQPDYEPSGPETKSTSSKRPLKKDEGPTAAPADVSDDEVEEEESAAQDETSLSMMESREKSDDATEEIEDVEDEAEIRETTVIPSKKTRVATRPMTKDMGSEIPVLTLGKKETRKSPRKKRVGRAEAGRVQSFEGCSTEGWDV